VRVAHLRWSSARRSRPGRSRSVRRKSRATWQPPGAETCPARPTCRQGHREPQRRARIGCGCLRLAERCAQARLRISPRFNAIQRDERCTDHGWVARHLNREPRADFTHAVADASQETLVSRLKQAAAEDDVNLPPRRVAPRDGRAAPRHTLVGEAVEDRTCDDVLLGGREHERRELGEPIWAELAVVEGTSQLDGRRDAEMFGYALLQDGLPAAPVFATCGCEECLPPNIVAAAPVAADLAERSEAHRLPVGPDADAVDTGPARHGNSEATVAAGAENCEGVVAHDVLGRPATPI